MSAPRRSVTRRWLLVISLGVVIDIIAIVTGYVGSGRGDRGMVGAALALAGVGVIIVLVGAVGLLVAASRAAARGLE